MTPNEIRQKGLEAVRKELGPIGLARFLQQFERGHGDYTQERREWLPEGSVREVVAELEENAPPKTNVYFDRLRGLNSRFDLSASAGFVCARSRRLDNLDNLKNLLAKRHCRPRRWSVHFRTGIYSRPPRKTHERPPLRYWQEGVRALSATGF